jgi:hypothetical protein
MARSYYGSQLSENMIETPEQYLICQNVPIGRIGWMEYLGEELGLEESRGKIIKVFRGPEELFSEKTIGSFEGKPITNNHPANNLDVSTVITQERGHMQNVRREGDFLCADLFIKDAGLISEIKENLKREVSCGYDCLWVPTGEGQYEQKDIIGNHVAVVMSGRAGDRVAIQDQKPKGGHKRMKISQKMLAAIGFKHFAKDAEPEDIANAMDALGSETETPGEQKKEDDGTTKILAAIQALADRVSALEQSDKKVHEEVGADAILDAAAAELETKDADPDPEEDKEAKKKEEAQDACAMPAKDAALKKFVQDMKPIIMAIPDEKARKAAAEQFVKSVRDARTVGAKDGYAEILKTVTENRKAAMDTKQEPPKAELSVGNWNAAGAKMRGGKQ